MYRLITQGFGSPESLLIFSCLRGGIDKNRPVMDVFSLTLALLPAEYAAKKCKK